MLPRRCSTPGYASRKVNRVTSALVCSNGYEFIRTISCAANYDTSLCKIPLVPYLIRNHNIKPTELKAIQDTFKALDKKGTGEVSVKDLIKGFQDCGFSNSAAELKSLLKKFAHDPDATIKYSEFLESAFDTRKHMNDAELLAMFNHIDT